MNNSPEISIIVPVYNAEKYLKQCIDSILSQDFTDFELLLINDGSKDSSASICDEYAQKDKRIRVFHKENGGVSSARNLGIDKAQGNYVAFIDSDDYIDSNYLSILTNIEADLVVTGYTLSGKGDCPTCIELTDSLYTGQEIANCLSSFLDKMLMRTPWDKLYNLKIIKKHSIYFNQQMRIAEDTVFVQTYLLYCKAIAFQSGTPYHYRIGPSNSSFSKYNLSPTEYLYSSNEILNIHKKIAQKFSLICDDYYKVVAKHILILYFGGVSHSNFTLKEYHQYKHTMILFCPKVHFSDTLYALTYKFIQKKWFLFSYLILSLIYPIKQYIDKNKIKKNI